MQTIRQSQGLNPHELPSFAPVLIWILRWVHRDRCRRHDVRHVQYDQIDECTSQHPGRGEVEEEVDMEEEEEEEEEVEEEVDMEEEEEKEKERDMEEEEEEEMEQEESVAKEKRRQA